MRNDIAPSNPGDSPSSCDVSDACDELGVDAVRSGLLRPAWSECPPASGPLTTVRLEPGGSARPLPELLDFLASSGRGVVLVDLSGRRNCQCWGSVLATAAAHHGVVGALINGCVRDVDELSSLRFPTYARGVHPAAMGGRLRVSATNEPVEIDDVLVQPHSFAVADASGAVFLPLGRAEEVLARAGEVRRRELEKLRAVSAGEDPRAVFLPRRQMADHEEAR